MISHVDKLILRSLKDNTMYPFTTNVFIEYIKELPRNLNKNKIKCCHTMNRK